jgi:hypothetical protein
MNDLMYSFVKVSDRIEKVAVGERERKGGEGVLCGRGKLGPLRLSGLM